VRAGAAVATAIRDSKMAVGNRYSMLLACCDEKFVLIYNKPSLTGFDESSSRINVRARRMVP